MIKLFQVLRNQEPGQDGGAPNAQPQQQAPAAAPITPQQQPAQEQPKPEVAPVKVTYKDPAAKQVMDMLTKAQLDPAQVRTALTDNDGQVTPEIYQALVTTHGEGMANLLASQMSTMHKAAVEKGQAQNKELYSFLEEKFKDVTTQSGEATFKELDQWAVQNLEAGKVAELNKLIKGGGMGAKLALQELTNTFLASGDFTQEMIGVTGDTAAPTGGGEPLSRAAYAAELAKLRQAGENYETSPKIRALQARRQRGIKQGL